LLRKTGYNNNINRKEHFLSLPLEDYKMEPEKFPPLRKMLLKGK